MRACLAGALGCSLVLSVPQRARAQEPYLIEPSAIPDSLAADISLRDTFARAVQAEERGRREEALALYMQVAERDPRNSELLIRIASCLAGLRRLEEALEQARAASAVDSTRTEARWIEGLTLVQLGRDAEAVASLRRAASSGAARTLDLLAGALERLGRDEELVEVLARLSLHYPDPARQRRAAVLERLGRDDEAIEQYREILRGDPRRDAVAERAARLLLARGRHDELIELQRQRAEALPEERGLRRSLIGSLIQDGRLDEAEAEIERQRQADPLDPYVELQLGMVDYRRGDLRAGMEHIDAAWRLAPDVPSVVRWRMRLQLAAGGIDSALVSAQRLRALRPADVEGARVEALAWIEKGHPQEALEALGAWAELDGRAAEPWMAAAGIHRHRRDWGAALEAVARAHERAPADTAILLEYAVALDAADRRAAADSIAAALLAARPDDPLLLNFYGYMLVEREHDLDRAEDLIRRALARSPEEPAFLDSMGWLWYKRGRLEEAARWLQRAIELGGRHPEIYAHLARVQIDMGRQTEAERTIRLGLGIEPHDLELRGLLEEIAGP